MNKTGRMLVVLAWATVVTAGCQPKGGSAIDAPSFNPSEIAEKAMSQCDSDSDGFLSAKELTVAASLQSALAELDTNTDKKISADEIAECMTNWDSSGVGLTSITSQVLMGGRPLVGATVTFEPKDFHGGSISPATGITDERGLARLISDDAKAQGFPDGMRLGFYKVRISKNENGKELVPAKYNEKTTLGAAISANARGDTVDFKLSRS